jgi:MFS family permease
MTKTSTFFALRNPVYRNLWFASLLSGTCVSAQETAATWVMNSLGASTIFLSLISTVSSLPFFLFTLPAGAMADIVDRRKLICVMNIWLAVAAGLLASFGWLNSLNPYIILTCIFLLGVGFAFNAPAWTAIVPEVVSNEELPSAAALGGLQLNLSGIIGPALGGILIPIVGSNWLFALNAACFLVVIFALLRWKRAENASKLPLESFFESLEAAIRYVRYTPGIQIVVARNVLFAFFISLIPALMPVVALKVVHLDASELGFLFTSMGAGSVGSAIFVIPWVRARCSSNRITIIANLIVVAVYLLMAFVHDHLAIIFVAALAGAGWTLSAAELWVASQRAAPPWARGRMNATIIMASQGAMALGGIIWGTSAVEAGVSYTLIAAALLLLISLALAVRFSIDFTSSLDLEPARVTTFSHKLLELPQPQDGPVLITYEFEIDPKRGRELIGLIREIRLIHLRNGAFNWHLDEDLGQSNIFRIEMMLPSWSGYLLQRERLTKPERELIDRAKTYHIGSNPLEERIFLCVNKELHTPASRLV